MIIAFVLISSDIGYDDQLVAGLETVAGVREVHSVYGTCDIIAKIEAENSEKIKKIVFSEIRTLPKVRSTLTLIASQ